MVNVAAIIPTHEQDPEILWRAIDSAITVCRTVLVCIDRAQEIPAHPDLEGVHYLISPGHGISAALNHGIANATTERIAFLDSDDQWLKGKRRQLANANHATYTDYRMTGTGDAVVKDDPTLVFSDNVPCRSTTMVLTQVARDIGGFDESLPYCQDWDFNARVQLYCGWHRVPNVLASIEDLDTGHTRTADGDVRSDCRQRVARANLVRETIYKHR